MACPVTVPQRPTCTFQERAIDVGAVPIYACVNKVQASGNRAAYNAGLRAGDRRANVGKLLCAILLKSGIHGKATNQPNDLAIDVNGLVALYLDL